MVGMKDFRVMTEEDRSEFGQILQDFIARRSAGQIQSQEASEAEEVAAAVSEAPAAQQKTAAVKEQNSQIQI